MRAAAHSRIETAFSFRRYIFTRRYHQGRGSRAGWSFVAYALGDANLPNPANWDELRLYLLRCEAEPAMLEAANIVWRSYLSHMSKARKLAAAVRQTTQSPQHLCGQPA